MPFEAQLLYFHMVLRADDDGVVESYPLMKLLSVAPDNFKVLVAKGFIRQLNEDQVIVVIDWPEHNTIRADRKVDSLYRHLLEREHPDIPLIAPKPRSDVEDNSRRLRGLSTDGRSQVRLGKDKISKTLTVGGFDDFWASYPKKTAKADAQRAWAKLNPSEALKSTIVSRVEEAKQSEQWQRDNGRYIPYPATYLNGRRWEDEIAHSPEKPKVIKI
jgi:hypothetical protein